VKLPAAFVLHSLGDAGSHGASWRRRVIKSSFPVSFETLIGGEYDIHD